MSETAAASAVTEIGSEDLGALSTEERASWQMTGQWPERKAPEAEPAKEIETDTDDDEPVAAVTAMPAAPAATDKPVSKRQQQINDLIRARAESDARATKLEAEIAALKTGKPAETAKPAETPEPVAVDPNDPEPAIEKYDDYTKYSRDLARWEARQVIKAERAAEAKRNQERAARDETAKREQGWIERRNAFAAKTPDFDAKVEPFLEGVVTGTPLGDVLADSPVGPQLALHLATHPEEAARIGRLAPLQQIRALGKLEALCDSPTAPAQAAAKTVTTAPAPPPTVTAGAAPAADDIADAVERGDFRAYATAANRRDLARK